LATALSSTLMGSAWAQDDRETLRIVQSTALKVVDPIFQNAYPVRNHGYLVFDTLFGVDDKYRPQPQMVKDWSLSDDKLTYSFTLRPGLKFHDGTFVKSEDCIASIKRWGSRDTMGRILMDRVASMNVVDDSTFTIVLKEPYGMVLDSIAKPGTYVPFVMPKRLADTPADQQVTEVIGSGPFRFVAGEFQPGVRAVYEKFADYIPRSEPPVWTSGGKVAKVDRIEWVGMPDSQTAANALMNGEVDFVEMPPLDMLDILEQTEGVVVKDVMQVGYNNAVYPNWLNPPFNNQKIRQALLLSLGQKDVLAAQVGNEKYYSECKAMFVCGSPYATDVGAPAGPDIEKAKELLKEGGYKGEKVVILQASDIAMHGAVSPVVAQALRNIGMNVEVQPMDIQTLFTRRGNQAPIAENGWSIYNGYWQSVDILNPITNVGVSGRGKNGGWFGWAEDEQLVNLRQDFIKETDETKRMQIVENIQKRAYDLVTYVPAGTFNVPYAYRDNVKGLLGGPGPVFWNVSKD
jgi:peptide/nickel transport system substrate-binding protein